MMHEEQVHTLEHVHALEMLRRMKVKASQLTSNTIIQVIESFALKTDLSTTRKALTQTNTALDSLSHELEKSTLLNSNLTIDLTESRETLTQTNAALDSLTLELEKSTLELDTHTTSLNKLKSLNKENLLQIKQKQTELDSSNKSMKDLEKQHKKHEIDVEKKRSENEQLFHEHDQLMLLVAEESKQQSRQIEEMKVLLSRN